MNLQETFVYGGYYIFFYVMRFFWILLLVALDLLTKFMFYDLKLVSRLFYPILNRGISFSIALHLDIVVFVSTIVIVAIIWLRKKNKIGCFESILILSGAFGNLIDRISYEGVRDFIRFGFGPVFNLADVFLTLGVCYILFTHIKKDLNQHIVDLSSK